MNADARHAESNIPERAPHRAPLSSKAAMALVFSLALAAGMAPRARANWVPARGTVDGRIRSAPYSPDQVYRLYGYVGYQIDIEFSPSERFLGLAAGDMNALAFKAEGNNLFLKPRRPHVHTNLTILTSRREYQFDYSASPQAPDGSLGEVIYALKFTYSASRRASAAALERRRISKDLARASREAYRNRDYWYCGAADLKPVAAFDDGVRTWIRFGARSELPAIFVKEDDGSESLVNFSIEKGDVVLQRVAKRFVLRRGKLKGCIVNEGFVGAGARMKSGTVSPVVERLTERPGKSRGGAR
jgi:type IV secretion system protein VirB9